MAASLAVTLWLFPAASAFVEVKCSLHLMQCARSIRDPLDARADLLHRALMLQPSCTCGWVYCSMFQLCERALADSSINAVLDRPEKHAMPCFLLASVLHSGALAHAPRGLQHLNCRPLLASSPCGESEFQ
jgi:hypothetical protein